MWLRSPGLAPIPPQIPRSISSLGVELPGGAVSRQPQPRGPNGFASGASAPAAAAPAKQEPRERVAVTRIFVIMIATISRPLLARKAVGRFHRGFVFLRKG